MPRMYAEGKFPKSRSTRDVFAELMSELDKKAYAAGQRVKDNVTVKEYESPIAMVREIRIEAEVVPL